MSDDEVFITAAFTYFGEKAKKIVPNHSRQGTQNPASWSIDWNDSDAGFTTSSKAGSFSSSNATSPAKAGKNANAKKNSQTVDDETAQILRDDLNKIGIPQPSRSNILVTKEGTVEFYWYTTRKNVSCKS
ncbi:hypothetical protein D9758_005519 [Tetrapyrgos nigripes]|uniref:Uncharacterized protein n=1 Tax=Tetrapyrgos nigripes TaxID=182062 RepID=A0A8H5LPH3_9AGAR|nr:hypothetical protein D9758_005519 [Tetrapyrgos nigripes]